MHIVGFTFDRELKDYILIKTVKISKWIDPTDLSLDIIFHLTIEHNLGKDEFKKLREFYLYFKEEDLDNITIEKKSQELEQELEEKISPFRGSIDEIKIKEIYIESENGKKRIKIVFNDYKINENTKKWNIKFLLKFNKKSINIINESKSTERNRWYYDCLIEPYLVQTLKWDIKEFMPLIGSLEVWLQIPRNLYGSLSSINVHPVRQFEQMFLLGEEIAEKFRQAKQPLAQEDTLCVNWTFSDISISSPPEEIEVTRGLIQYTEEDNFVKRFKVPENSILVLREILYTCKVKTIDFNYIISNISDKRIKNVLEILNIMVFQKNLKRTKENLESLLPLLEHFRDLPYGEEFFIRYDIFHDLIRFESSEIFSSDQILLKLKQIQELEDVLDPDYTALMQDFIHFFELTRQSRFKKDFLFEIDRLDYKWTQNIMYPDKYILIDILANWKNIIEKEYEEKIPLPEIKARIKTKHLAYADQVGFVLSITNAGAGEAKDVFARLIEAEDYSMIEERTETKALLTNRQRAFEPELVLEPKNAERITVTYEIRYKDIQGNDAKKTFKESIDLIMEKIKFNKIENPYITGGIVREERMFFGREELIQNIIDTFRGKYSTNPLFLYGQRRIGKTSILFHLKKRLANEFAPVFFTTLEIFGKRSFYEDLMKRIKKELGFTDIEIPNIDDDPFNEFKSKFYDPLKERLKGRKIVLMIDEYQRIDEFIAEGHYDDTVIDFLNALVEDGEINVILAGFLQPDELQNRKWIDLMRFFTTKNVSFLSREDTINLICEPVKGLMQYDDGGIEKIISLSGCHPYFVQLICHTMVEHHNSDKVNLIGYINVNRRIFRYLEKGENILFDIILAQTEGNERRILFSLCTIMEGKNTVSVQVSEIKEDLISKEELIEETDIEKALSYLGRKEIIRKSADSPHYYEFTVDLYKLWIREKYPDMNGY